MILKIVRIRSSVLKAVESSILKLLYFSPQIRQTKTCMETSHYAGLNATGLVPTEAVNHVKLFRDGHFDYFALHAMLARLFPLNHETEKAF